MNDSELLWSLASRGVNLELDDGQNLRYRIVNDSLDPDLRELIVDHRAGIIDELAKPDTPNQFIPVTSQQAIYFRPLGGENSGRWVKNAVAFRIDTRFEADVFRKAVEHVARRHPLLRAEFREVDGRLACGAYPSVPIQLSFEEQVDMPRDLDELIAEDEDLHFDPGQRPLWAMRVINHPTGSVVVFLIQWIISDGWSIHLILEEIIRSYCGATDEVLGVPGDFGEWSASVPLAGVRREASQPMVAIDSGPVGIARIVAAISYEDLTEMARICRTTTFAMTLSAYAIAVSELHGKNQITISSPRALRFDETHDRVVGHMVRSDALDFDFAHCPTLQSKLDHGVDVARALVTSGLRQEPASGEALRYYFNFLDFSARRNDTGDIHIFGGEIAGTSGGFHLKVYIWGEEGQTIYKFVYSEGTYSQDMIYDLARRMDTLLMGASQAEKVQAYS